MVRRAFPVLNHTTGSKWKAKYHVPTRCHYDNHNMRATLLWNLSFIWLSDTHWSTTVIVWVYHGIDICSMKLLSNFPYPQMTVVLSYISECYFTIRWTVTDTHQWAFCQIRKIAGAHAPRMPGTFSPSPQVRDPDMHHGTCVTHVPWCMPGSLTSGFLWNRRRGNTFPVFPAHAQPAILRLR